MAAVHSSFTPSLSLNQLFCPLHDQLFSMQSSSHGGCSLLLHPLPPPPPLAPLFLSAPARRPLPAPPTPSLATPSHFRIGPALAGRGAFAGRRAGWRAGTRAAGHKV